MPAQRKAAARIEARGDGGKHFTSSPDFTALVRHRATGQWPEILAGLGIDAGALRNRHGPCPGCGGRDRFRFDDAGARGTFICGGGGEPLAGDGFALLMHVYGWRFPEAVEEVARALGLQPGEAKQANAAHVARLQEQARQRQAQADAERVERHRRCAADAAALWSRGEPVTRHAYLQRKAVQAHGIRQAGGLLLVPMHDAAGELWNVQKIDAAGQKCFLPGRKRGLFHLMGTPGRWLALAEGYATAATVHEATGWPVAVAFDAGNLLPVAEALARRHPAAGIAVYADHDAAGLKGARNAAQAVGGIVCAPATPGQDWNDAGAAAVREAARALAGPEVAA